MSDSTAGDRSIRSSCPHVRQHSWRQVNQIIMSTCPTTQLATGQSDHHVHMSDNTAVGRSIRSSCPHVRQHSWRWASPWQLEWKKSKTQVWPNKKSPPPESPHTNQACKNIPNSLSSCCSLLVPISALKHLDASCSHPKPFRQLHCILCLTTLTEVYPCFFLSCKTNARVKPANTGHGPHSS